MEEKIYPVVEQIIEEKKDPVVEQLIEILPHLSYLNYSNAISFVEDMKTYRETTNLKNFWSLCSIIWNSDNIESQKEGISQWLLQTVIDSLPSQLDPFLHALFTHNTDELQEQGKFIDEAFPIILASPPPEVGFKTQSIPDYLKNRSFLFGNGKKISGSSIWTLLCGSISEIAEYDIDWRLLLALHFWYCFPYPDIQAGFISFVSFIHSRTDDLQDPIYLLLLLHSRDPTASISEIASSLPPFDALIFVAIVNQLEQSSVDITNIIYSLSGPVADQLTQLNHWEAGLGLLFLSNRTSEFILSLRRGVSPSREFSQQEKDLITIFEVPENNIKFAKADKCIYLSNIVSNVSIQLKLLADAAFLFAELGDIKRAENIFGNRFLPLMTFEGIDVQNEAIELAQFINQCYPHSDQSGPGDDVKMILILKKCFDNKLTEDDLAYAGKTMENNWSNFPLRREICTLLLKSHTAYKYLKNVDAAPKAQLLTYSQP